jgi:hypothetical protein
MSQLEQAFKNPNNPASQQIIAAIKQDYINSGGSEIGWQQIAYHYQFDDVGGGEKV